MGLIRAAVGSVGGTLADSWLDYIAGRNSGAFCGIPWACAV